MIVNYSDSASDSESDESLSPTNNLFKREILPRKLQEQIQKQKNYLKLSKPENKSSDENEQIRRHETPKNVGFLSNLPDPINKTHIKQSKSAIIKDLNNSPPNKKVKSDNPYLCEHSPASKTEKSVEHLVFHSDSQEVKMLIPENLVKSQPETNWKDVIKKTVGKNQSNINIKDIQVVDLTDDDIVGDTRELFRGRIQPQQKLFQNKNISKPTNIESNKRKVNYLAYQAQQQEIRRSDILDYTPRKRSNREQYGF